MRRVERERTEIAQLCLFCCDGHDFWISYFIVVLIVMSATTCSERGKQLIIIRLKRRIFFVVQCSYRPL